MKATLEELAKKFIENRDVAKHAFIMESAYIYPVCASVFINKRKAATVEGLKNCLAILKNNTGIFSNFRSNAKLPMIAMMAASDTNPKEKLNNALKVYEELKEYFMTSQYLPVASMMIADLVDVSQYEQIAARTRNIYNLMKSEHPFLTSSEDSVFAALLALSDLSAEQLVNEVEKCYEILKPQFFSANAVQSLSHVLALAGEGSAEDKCKKTMELFNKLKAEGHKYGTDYELATLGALAILPVEVDELVRDILDVDMFLADKSGYGFLGIGRKQRLMHAGMIVSSNYIDSMDSNKAAGSAAAAIGSTISLIAAQQAAMCAAIAASIAAVSANSSSN